MCTRPIDLQVRINCTLILGKTSGGEVELRCYKTAGADIGDLLASVDISDDDRTRSKQIDLLPDSARR